MLSQTPKNTRIYAIADVHGMLTQLETLFEQIKEDSAHFSGRKVLVMLGDYIDKGMFSAQVLELLSTLEWKGWECIFLKGNHEYGCLTFVDDPESVPQWTHDWGGDAMLQSYGVPVAHTSKPKDLRDKLLHRMPAHHLSFLRNLPTHHIEGDYLFVHAGVRQGIPLEKQSEWDKLFIREPDFEPNLPHKLPYCIVYGHRPKKEPLICDDRICIDTGAYRGGQLTAVALEGDEVHFLQA